MAPETRVRITFAKSEWHQLIEHLRVSFPDPESGPIYYMIAEMSSKATWTRPDNAQCRERTCQKTFAVKAWGRLPEYCSNACRMRAHRRRAKELRATAAA